MLRKREEFQTLYPEDLLPLKIYMICIRHFQAKTSQSHAFLENTQSASQNIFLYQIYIKIYAPFVFLQQYSSLNN